MATIPIERPDTIYPVPSDELFESEETDFLPALDIEAIGRRLVEHYPEFWFLKRYAVAYCWKRAGGRKAMKATLGKCQKTSGPLKHFAQVDFLITISADHCREFAFTNRMMTALVFHELKHCAFRVDQKGNESAAIVGHDTEHFFQEVREFGLWTPDLVEAAATFRQQRFPFQEQDEAPASEPGPTPTERVARLVTARRLTDEALTLMGAPS